MILVLGGTSDAVDFCHLLKENNVPYQMTVATLGGMEMATREGLNAMMTRFTKESLRQYLEDHQVTTICDLTHPHALEISQLAMGVASEYNVGYLRYERPVLEVTNETDLMVSDMSEAATLAAALGNVILVTGSKHVALFEEQLTRRAGKRVIYRVIPRQEVIAEVSALGVGMDRMIAMQGPFTQEMNTAIFRAFKVDVVIGKEGGQASGTAERHLAAKELGVKNIVVNRPSFDYINRFNNVTSLYDALMGHGASANNIGKVVPELKEEP